MKLLKPALMTVLLALGVGSAHVAVASPQIAKQYKCLECHVLDKKVIGPSIRDMAKKY